MKEAYAQGVEAELEGEIVGDQIKPKDVGHNIYILAHQVLFTISTHVLACWSLNPSRSITAGL